MLGQHCVECLSIRQVTLSVLWRTMLSNTLQCSHHQKLACRCRIFHAPALEINRLEHFALKLVLQTPNKKFPLPLRPEEANRSQFGMNHPSMHLEIQLLRRTWALTLVDYPNHFKSRISASVYATKLNKFGRNSIPKRCRKNGALERADTTEAASLTQLPVRNTVTGCMQQNNIQ